MDKDKGKKPEEEDIIFEEEESQDSTKKLREKLKKAVQEKQEYLAGWQRAKADFVNYKKEEDKRKETSLGFAKEKLFSSILPVLDSFTEAEKSSSWNEGMDSIKNQLENVLKESGIEKITELSVFNPLLHESVEMIPTDKEGEDGQIEEVFQDGYKMGERVIRPAKVKVKIYQSK